MGFKYIDSCINISSDCVIKVAISLIIIFSYYLFSPTCIFALTDAKYNEFKSSKIFSDVDDELGIVWREITSNIDNNKKQILLNDQREWIKHGWDDDALNISSKKGLSLVEAYAEACKNRILYLKNNYSSMTSNDREVDSKVTNNTDVVGTKKVGIYDFYLGEDFNSIITECIEKKYYINIKSNSDLPNIFSNYINNNTHLTVNGDMSIDNNNVDGKYLNIINNKTSVSAVLGNKSVNINNHIPNNVEELVRYISDITRNLPMPSGFHGGRKSQYVPKIFNKLGINYTPDSVENLYDNKFYNFIDEVSSNIENKYDIKNISLKINNQNLNMFFMNSPGFNIHNILFFICLDVSNVSMDKNIKDKINDVFIKRYGKAEILSPEVSYYSIGNNLILHDDYPLVNRYFFINKDIMNYFIKSSEMLYNKYKDSTTESLINGM